MLPTAAAHAAFAGVKAFVGSPSAACPMARSCLHPSLASGPAHGPVCDPLSVLPVPDKPEELWLDSETGSLRWNSLPSCKGEIIGYQVPREQGRPSASSLRPKPVPVRSLPQPGTGKGRRAGTLPAAGTFPAGSWELLHSSCVSCLQLNITARNAGDSSVLETERLRLNGSVTELRLPEHSPGSSYAVAIQGLTAAGAGAALLKELHTSNSSGKLCCDCPRSLGTHEPCSAACPARGCPCSSPSPAQAHWPGVPLQTPRCPRPSAAAAPSTSPHRKARPCWP